MLANYLPVFIFILLALLVGIVATRLGGLVRPNHPNTQKLMPYECGLLSVNDLPQMNTVPFYLLAVLFLLFDVEILFFFPWALLFDRLTLSGFAEMLVFMGILFVGYFYCWKKGAFEWRH